MYEKNGNVRDRREMLRVKIKSLAEEARIIRREERRARAGQLRDELHRHRVLDVRREARSAHVAYALIRGRTLASVEAPGSSAPDWKRIKQLATKYGPPGFTDFGEERLAA